MTTGQRILKFRFFYGIEGKVDTCFRRDFTLAECMNGEPFEELSDTPLLRDYKMLGEVQFTGLLDSNGVEIYEGDLVVFDDSDIGGHRCDVAEVFYCTDLTLAHCPGFNLWSHSPQQGFLHFGLGRAEVIGNIYEHPSLIPEIE